MDRKPLRENTFTAEAMSKSGYGVMIEQILKEKMTGLPAILVVTFLCVCTGLDCKKEAPIVPPTQPSHPKLSWQVDTIVNPYAGSQLTLQGIWGTSPTNVYACGFNGAGGATLWHFNGTVWSYVRLNASQGGLIQGAIYLNAIYGFSENNIWAVGDKALNTSSPPYVADSSSIIHYDGANWTEVLMNRGAVLTAIAGISPTEIYAVSIKGEVFRYDGIEWKKYLIDSTATLFSVGGDDQRQFIGGYHELTSNSYYSVYSRSGNSDWVEISRMSDEENQLNPKFGYHFYAPGGNSYYSSGYGIFSFGNSAWTREYYDGYPYSSIAGTGTNNIYAISPFAKVIQWDGNDWAFINLPSNVAEYPYFNRVWVSGTDVFISSYGMQDNRSYILHGHVQK